MKKLFAILLAVTLVASMAMIVSAANTTTLTTTVPAATYTLNIPADQVIPFGATATNIGEISVTDSAGFAEGKNLKVTLTYTDFVCETASTTIPFVIRVSPYTTAASDTSVINVASGEAITFIGLEKGTVEKYVSSKSGNELENTWILMNSEDWGKALAGEYTATITFTAEVVVE